MPVRNEATHIVGVLEQIFSQTLDPDRFEVLVVDGFSEDGTRDLVRDYAQSHPNVYLIDNPGFISGIARNIGVRARRRPLRAVHRRTLPAG